ncbi:unnamed protein product [Prorocentrum cordatum]|uniref:Uncharacterized protein n=1 Tax=Prorocentrum cordatum TaxID=2364126 RepID=A0ABN9U6C3_9DINO|nr:unnamed protein product [Polarella glacialis]
MVRGVAGAGQMTPRHIHGKKRPFEGFAEYQSLPEVLNETIQNPPTTKKVFTNGGDRGDIATHRYRYALFAVIGDANVLEIPSMGLGGPEAADIMKHHIRLGLGDDKQLAGCIQTVRTLVDSTELRLAFTKVGGDTMPAQALVDLTTLRLVNAQNTKLTGHIQAFWNLVSLTSLNLSGTHVSVDVQAVRKLVDLTKLDFSYTQVLGDIQDVGGPVNLTVLRVSGDIQTVEALASLTGLRLWSTQVTGDIRAVRNFVNLTPRDLHCGTQVSGNVQLRFFAGGHSERDAAAREASQMETATSEVSRLRECILRQRSLLFVEVRPRRDCAPPCPLPTELHT